MIRMRKRARELALQGIFQLQWDCTPMDRVLQFEWINDPVENDEAEFARLLIRGAAAYIEKSDRLIGKYSDQWTLDRISKIDLSILRLSIYSLYELKDIPPKVTINEAIEMAKKYSDDNGWRYINGILDGIWHREMKQLSN